MKRGDRVRVMAAGGHEFVGVVWEETSRAVLICSTRGYRRYRSTKEEPSTVGFKQNYVRPEKTNEGRA